MCFLARVLHFVLMKKSEYLRPIIKQVMGVFPEPATGQTKEVMSHVANSTKNKESDFGF